MLNLIIIKINVNTKAIEYLRKKRQSKGSYYLKERCGEIR